jgi:hypothetical protein
MTTSRPQAGVWLVAAALCALVGPPAPAAQARPAHRLWYRISIAVHGTARWDSGQKAIPNDGFHDDQIVTWETSWSAESVHAVVVSAERHRYDSFFAQFKGQLRLGSYDLEGHGHTPGNPDNGVPDNDCTTMVSERLNHPVEVSGFLGQSSPRPRLILTVDGPPPDELRAQFTGQFTDSCTAGGADQKSVGCSVLMVCGVTMGDGVPTFIRYTGDLSRKLAFRVPAGRYGRDFSVVRHFKRESNFPHIGSRGFSRGRIHITYHFHFHACPRHGRKVAGC